MELELLGGVIDWFGQGQALSLDFDVNWKVFVPASLPIDEFNVTGKL